MLPEHRARGFDLFEALLTASGARFMEIQSSDVLLNVMLHTYARDIWEQKFVFHDAITTALPASGGMVQRLALRTRIYARPLLSGRAAPSISCCSTARP